MKLTTKQYVQTSVFIALTFVITRFVQIPIPLGYFNVGNSIILLTCLLLPNPCGILIGSIGSALADLTSYPAYTIPTFIIKALMPYLFYKLNKKVHPTINTAIVTLIPLFGYTITGMILYSNFFTGLAQFPGLFLEYLANIVIFHILSKIRFKQK